MPFATHAVGWTAEGQVPPTAREQQVLELTCNGLVSFGLCCSVLRDGVSELRVLFESVFLREDSTKQRPPPHHTRDGARTHARTAAAPLSRAQHTSPHNALFLPHTSHHHPHNNKQKAVPYAMSVASVQKFLWKRSDDVVFHYRVLDPARPAPLPVFKPPPR